MYLSDYFIAYFCGFSVDYVYITEITEQLDHYISHLLFLPRFLQSPASRCCTLTPLINHPLLASSQPIAIFWFWTLLVYEAEWGFLKKSYISFISFPVFFPAACSSICHILLLSLSLSSLISIFSSTLTLYLLFFTDSQVNEDAFCEVSERGDGDGPLAWQQPILWGQGAGLWCQKSALHGHL